MTTRKKKTETKKNISVGQAVEYNGKQYKVVYMFGSANQYATIENVDERISVKTEAIQKTAPKGQKEQKDQEAQK